MSLPVLLSLWRKTPSISANIAAWRTFPARPAQFVPFPNTLHPALIRALQSQGIKALFTHQATTWEQVQRGYHPVIVTGTASGKTLCYNLPVLHHLLSHPQTRALYLFPTKALTYDQTSALQQLTAALKTEPAYSERSIPVATYDGDTPLGARPKIRDSARLLLSNPDMLHAGILPHHTKWSSFFRHLRFVVIDELHTYRGVFGSHVANVIRRLKRVSHFYRTELQFILTSATIANPTELAGRLIEEPTVLVENDGSARGAKHFLIYNPPVINEELGLRRSVLQETTRLSQELLLNDVQTIIFGRTRRTVEMILSHLRQSYPQEDQIRAYRSGYLPRQRRDIEQELREGSARAVVATSALELGIDIGSMGAAVLAGYPGTIAGCWQQAGRAGRQSEASLALMISSANPLDQFLAHHPNYFFERSPEQALINPDNLLILLQHIRCAAFELPFETGEAFGQVVAGQVGEFLDFLHQSGDIHRSGQKFFWMADQYPAEQVSLRSASPAVVNLQVQNEDERWVTIGEVDLASAVWMVHPQAVYLHEGQSYLVEALDLDHHQAQLRPLNLDYYTEPLRETSVQLVARLDQAAVRNASRTHGEIIVTTQVVGYRMVQWFTNERLGNGEVDLPPNELHTTGYWLALKLEAVDQLRQQGLWTNDPNDYGVNWPSQRNRARARDGYRCQACGTPEQGRGHDVHHKAPFRTFPTYQQANQLANLVTLCRPCHRRAEMAVRIRTGLAGLATVLGHLAPLFLMCDIHDVGIHTDPKSPLSDGHPTVVIYDRVPAGMGFSKRLFELHEALLSQAYDMVLACPCADGCPSCVGPAGEAGTGGKQETKAILELLVL